ncbi:RHS repeat-associated core domain-containing protein [Pseudomonas sp.]|uniref:RHS repeat-associated core domain-containing protein n=1 Tax=Pseudomonas sp. TaxID=306 RepID=UPI0027B99C75|nr:RHS repeat-associated core domain-containing protein [Pseudomonas sp.]
MSTIDKKLHGVRLFYVNSRLVSLIGLENTRLMRADSMALAQLNASTRLLQIDGANTVVAAHAVGLRDCQGYSPYGFSPVQKKLAMIAFTGEWRDTQTGCYPLGNGHRLFSPSLRRLTEPDVLSPFGKGGLNAYAYCGNDPVNRVDPSGGIAVSASGLAKWFGFTGKTGLTNTLKEAGLPKGLKRHLRGRLSQGALSESGVYISSAQGPARTFSWESGSLKIIDSDFNPDACRIGSIGQYVVSVSQVSHSEFMAPPQRLPPPSFDEAMQHPIFDSTNLGSGGLIPQSNQRAWGVQQISSSIRR